MKRSRTKLLLALMALMGISACTDEPDMYGCLPSEYIDSLSENTSKTANSQLASPLENEK